MSSTRFFTAATLLAVASSFSASLLAAPSHPSESRTLQRIHESGMIKLGYRESALPFSFADSRDQPAGYAVDLCLSVAEAVRRRENLPELKVRWIPLTPQNRIPAVSNGLVDLDCAPNTNTVERQKQVAFSVSHYVSSVRLLVPRAEEISSLADLRGKSVVTSAGSTGDRHVRRLKAEYGYRDIYAKDHGESFLLLESGRAKAFVMDDVLLAGLRARAKDPEQYVITGPALSVEQNALMMARDDLQWKALVDATLIEIFRSPQIRTLHARWFEQPVGPRGVNLRLPPSKEVLAAWKQPSDRAGE
jgi:ABC-type amino acid transport substrate-binding protein